MNIPTSQRHLFMPLLVAFAVLAMMMAPAVDAKKFPKFEICKYNKNTGEYKLKYVSEKHIERLINKGARMPGEALDSNQSLDDQCNIIPYEQVLDLIWDESNWDDANWGLHTELSSQYFV